MGDMIGVLYDLRDRIRIDGYPAFPHANQCHGAALPLINPSHPVLPCTADSLPGSCLFVRETRDVVYVHCWGGRGRAGTVGACLYLMLRYKDGTSFDVEVR